MISDIISIQDVAVIFDIVGNDFFAFGLKGASDCLGRCENIDLNITNNFGCNSRISMLIHVFMAKIKQIFLVTIEIDTEKAKPFPNGFKDPATNNGNNGMNWNTYPNWEINYQGQERSFIEMVWADF